MNSIYANSLSRTFYPPKQGVPADKEIIKPQDINIFSNPIAPITISQLQKTSLNINFSKYLTNPDTFKDFVRKINNCFQLFEQGKIAFEEISNSKEIPANHLWFDIVPSIKDDILKKSDASEINSFEEDKLIAKQKLIEIKEPIYKKTFEMMHKFDKPLEWQKLGEQTDPRISFLKNMYIDLFTTYGIFMLFGRNAYQNSEKLTTMDTEFSIMLSNVLRNNYMTPEETRNFFSSISKNFSPDFVKTVKHIENTLTNDINLILKEMKENTKTIDDAIKYKQKIETLLNNLANEFITNTIPITPNYLEGLEKKITDEFKSLKIPQQINPA